MSRKLSVFLIGPGSVGSEFLRQVAAHKAGLLLRHGLDIRLLGVANSRRMLLSTDGVGLDTWADELGATGTAVDLSRFVSSAQAALPAVVVDCSAADAPLPFYRAFLEAGVNVVVANKKGLSGPQAFFDEITALASRASGPKFLGEANVGAGLPIITTLKRLTGTGDTVTQIEAVLSGTLSFIFNSLAAGKKFSAAVLDAKQLGYTEPDPRDDLSSLDAARKLLILARLSGLKLELGNIVIEPLLSPEVATAPTVEEFLQRLPQEDSRFEQHIAKAQAEGKVLRYIARLDVEKQKASIELCAVETNHPCAGLSGADNLISISSHTYPKQPLVIKGPGAGVPVTAGAVFSDVLFAAGLF
eukprot:TRINITY_DN4755_c0_g1_i1.p1 TRINITY_DN4755_c0_g1~~TRINITY_DN4755_c0_g1_i1.p1  ORF type:complete len:366 (+),score=73.22 TRINITY_DN4755_c0_g1_i1:27-1100(+)